MASTAGLLPPGRIVFLDINGDPLVGGTVGYYIPGGLTPTDTWQDPDMTILNDNPLTLDSYGAATVWGLGTYRQIVKDVNGNLIEDALTSPGAGSGNITPGVSIAFSITGLYPTPSFPTALVTNDPLPTGNQTIQVDTASACGIHNITGFGNATCFQVPQAGTYGFSLTLTAISGNLPADPTTTGLGGLIYTANSGGGSPTILPAALIQTQGFWSSAAEYSGFVETQGAVTVVATLSESVLVFPTWSNEPPDMDNYTSIQFSNFCGWLVG